jgi:hypothetical protein
MIEFIIIITIFIRTIIYITIIFRFKNNEVKHEIIEKRIYKKLCKKLQKENSKKDFILSKVKRQAKDIRILKNKLKYFNK